MVCARGGDALIWSARDREQFSYRLSTPGGEKLWSRFDFDDGDGVGAGITAGMGPYNCDTWCLEDV